MATEKRANALRAKGKEVDFQALLKVEPDRGTTNVRNTTSKTTGKLNAHWGRWLGPASHRLCHHAQQPGLGFGLIEAEQIHPGHPGQKPRPPAVGHPDGQQLVPGAAWITTKLTTMIANSDSIVGASHSDVPVASSPRITPSA